MYSLEKKQKLISDIETAYKNGVDLISCCKRHGTNPTSFYRWIEELNHSTVVKRRRSGLEENQKLLFSDFVFQQIEKKRESLSRESYYSYRSSITKLLKFKPVIQFSDLDEEFINNYRRWMLNRGNNENTASKSLRTLRTMVNMAIRHDHILKNPFQWVRIKKVTGKRDYLNIDEFNNLYSSYKIGGYTNIEKQVFRCFLFCCLTGLRYTDMRLLKATDITDNIVSIKMHKTGLPVTVPLSTKALELLQDGWFRVYCNKVTNRVLRGIIEKSGIKKRVTFHVARHTFATISITLGMPIEVVSKLLGHTDIKTTQIYAKVVDTLKIKEMLKWNF